MKTLLVAINLILAALVTHSAIGLLRTGEPQLELKSGKKRAEKTARPAAEKRSAAAPRLQTTADAVRIIANRNIFDPARCPNALGVRGGRGTGSFNNMSLVGVCRVDGAEGAVILFKNAGRSNTAAMTGSLRINNRAVPTLGSGSAGQTNTATQCYFRKGATLPNGYVLSAVNPTGVILTRGASQMTLNLALASENAAKTGTRRTAANPMQQMLQLMQRSVNMQQMQQMNMMRMMRNQQQPASGGATRSTNTRSR